MLTLDGHLLPGIAFGRDRFVIWRWRESPLGPVSAIGRFDVEGRLTLYTATPAYADLLRVWHRVHDVKRGEVLVRLEGGRLRAVARPDDAAEIDLDLVLGWTAATAAMNLSLGLLLPWTRRSAAFVAASGPVARALLGVGAGRRFVGRTETGRSVCVASRSLVAVRGGRASVGGQDCGGLRAVDDPPDWGQLAMPRRPYLLACELRVDAPVPDLLRGPSAAAGARVAP